MSRDTAKRKIKRFLNKYRGKSVLFATLNDTDKYNYVLTKQYNYFRGFLKPAEALDRAISNTEGHKKSRYSVYRNISNEHMIIASK